MNRYLLDYYFSGNTNNHKKVAIFMAAGIMLHNFPEGLIMGIGFMANDALGINLKNIGSLLNSKNIYFVPFYLLIINYYL